MDAQSIYDSKPWLKSYEKNVPAEIEFESACLPQFFERTVTAFGDRKALIFEGFSITYTEMKDMVDRMAAALSDFGVTKGTSVAILLPNLIPTVIANYAIMKLGGIVVMNNPLYSDRELEHQFNDSKSKVLITLDLLANRMIDLRPKTPVKQIIVTSIGDYLPFPKSLVFPLVAKKKKLAAAVKPADDVYRWKTLIKKYPPKKEFTALRFEDTALFQYTGGTTGPSKGVVLTHGNLSKQAQQIAAWFPQFPHGQEIMLGALPFFHVFGLTTSMNLSIYFGWTNILIPKPQPDQLLEAIKRYRPTFAPLVPTMYIGIVNHPECEQSDLTSLKGCFSGSAPLPIDVIQEFESKTGATIVEGFGLTESCPVTHINPFADGERKVGSVGIPVSNTECRIVDIENSSIIKPVGESGEIIMRGPQIMKEYWGNPEATSQTLRDGWLFTGDIAKMDEDGYFYIVDRKKDMIISGGFNVFPREIDEVYFEHPKIQEACTIGIPHKSRGEAAKVYIVMKKGEKSTEADMLEFCHDKLAKYKWPIEIEFTDELPKSAVGKILRKELRTMDLAKRK